MQKKCSRVAWVKKWISETDKSPACRTETGSLPVDSRKYGKTIFVESTGEPTGSRPSRRRATVPALPARPQARGRRAQARFGSGGREKKSGPPVHGAHCPGSPSVPRHDPAHVGEPDPRALEVLDTAQPLEHVEELASVSRVEPGPPLSPTKTTVSCRSPGFQPISKEKGFMCANYIFRSKPTPAVTSCYECPFSRTCRRIQPAIP